MVLRSIMSSRISHIFGPLCVDVIGMCVSVRDQMLELALKSSCELAENAVGLLKQAENCMLRDCEFREETLPFNYLFSGQVL